MSSPMAFAARMAPAQQRRAAAGEHVHVGGLVGGQPAIDVVGDVGGQLFVGGLGQHARDVEGDVARAQDGDMAGLQRPVARHVWVPVVPGHEIGCAVAPGQIDARNVQRPVFAGAGGEDNRVVVTAQVGQLDVGAVVDVADEAARFAREHPAERLEDLLDEFPAARILGAKKGSNLIRIISALQVAELGYSFFDPNAKTGVGGVDTVIRMDPADPFFMQTRLIVQDEAHHVLKANKWGIAAGMFPNARGLLPTATWTRLCGRVTPTARSVAFSRKNRARVGV